MDLIAVARKIANEAHQGQFRKYHAHVPYTTHTERVSLQMFQNGFDLAVCAAALLHDVFEDCDKRYRNVVADECGPQVYVMVHELTNPSKGLKCKREIRKTIDREALKYVSHPSACIKLADRADNLRDLSLAGDKVADDFKRLYCEESRLLLGVLEQYHHPKITEAGRRLYDDYWGCLGMLERGLQA